MGGGGVEGVVPGESRLMEATAAVPSVRAPYCHQPSDSAGRKAQLTGSAVAAPPPPLPTPLLPSHRTSLPFPSRRLQLLITPGERPIKAGRAGRRSGEMLRSGGASLAWNSDAVEPQQQPQGRSILVLPNTHTHAHTHPTLPRKMEPVGKIFTIRFGRFAPPPPGAVRPSNPRSSLDFYFLFSHYQATDRQVCNLARGVGLAVSLLQMWLPLLLYGAISCCWRATVWERRSELLYSFFLVSMATVLQESGAPMGRQALIESVMWVKIEISVDGREEKKEQQWGRVLEGADKVRDTEGRQSLGRREEGGGGEKKKAFICIMLNGFPF